MDSTPREQTASFAHKNNNLKTTISQISSERAESAYTEHHSVDCPMGPTGHAPERLYTEVVDLEGSKPGGEPFVGSASHPLAFTSGFMASKEDLARVDTVSAQNAKNLHIQLELPNSVLRAPACMLCYHLAPPEPVDHRSVLSGAGTPLLT